MKGGEIYEKDRYCRYRCRHQNRNCDLLPLNPERRSQGDTVIEYFSAVERKDKYDSLQTRQTY